MRTWASVPLRSTNALTSVNVLASSASWPSAKLHLEVKTTERSSRDMQLAPAPLHSTNINSHWDMPSAFNCLTVNHLATTSLCPHATHIQNAAILQFHTCYFPATAGGISSTRAAARTLIRKMEAPKKKISRPMPLEK